MMDRSPQFRRSLAVALATGGVICALVAADLRSPAMATPAVSGQVYMPDSAAATERFTLARNLEKASDWDKAADVYQELLEKYPDKVVAPGAAGGAGAQYMSVRRLAQQMLCKWPAEALAVYRGKYGALASAMLASADSPGELAAVARRYLLTDAGTSAALQLLDRYWSSGRLVEAARWGKTLLELHPSIEPQRPGVCFEVAMACHLTGDDAAAEAMLKDMRSRYPEAVGTVAGRDVVLATELAEQLKIPATNASRSLDAWPMFGGSADRAGVTASSARVDALLYSLDFGQGISDAGGGAVAIRPPGMAGVPMPVGIAGSAMNQAAGIMPVADHGELFVADGKRLYGISIDSGMKLPGWSGTAVPLAEESVPRGMRTVTVTERSVLTVVGASSLGRLLRGNDASSGLRCMDRATGATRWTFRASTLPAALRNIQLVSSVLAADGSVYVAAQGGKGAQIDDAYLLCLDENTGSCRWATYIASGPSVGAAMDGDSPYPAEPMTPQFSLAAGRLIVATNLGVIAALDVADGAIAWMTPYERPVASGVQPWQMGRLMRRGNAGLSNSGWAASPPIIVESQVYVLPADGTAILTLDAETGEIRKTLPRKAVDDADLLLAVDHGEMVLSSDHSAWCVDAGMLDATGNNIASATLWNMRFGGATLRGRPFLTTEFLYIPTSERIFRVGRSKWKIADVYPAYSQSWPKDEGPGNILVTADHVAIATAGRLNIYASLASATAKLDKAAAADPTSPEPLLRYAELLVAAHQASPALAKLKAAIPLTADSAAAMERAFNLSLNVWKQLVGSSNAEDAGLAPAYFQCAQACARLPRQRAQLWIAAGDSAAGREQWPQAVEAYQQVLGDRDARNLLTTAANGTSLPAWQRSYASLKRIIDAKGRSLYGKYDQLASAAMAKAAATATAAGGSEKADALLEIGEQFPNSSSAAAALMRGARLLEKGKQYRRSADVLRRLYQVQPADEFTPGVIEAMARVYCAIPRRSVVAASRLALGAETLKNPRLAGEIRLSTGQVISNVTFAEAAAMIRKQAREQDREPMPDFALPANAGQEPFKPSSTWKDIDGLIAANDGAEREDRVVARSSAGEVVVIEAGKPEPLMRQKLTTGKPERYFWIDQLLVVWSDKELTAVQPPKGAAQWKLTPGTMLQATQPVELTGETATAAGGGRSSPGGQIELMPDASAGIMPQAAGAPDGEGETIARCDGNSAQVVFATSNGRLAAVDAATGRLAWQTQLNACVAERLLCGEDFTVVGFTDGSPLQLAAFDNATGQVVFRVARGSSGLVQNFDLAGDGRLVFTFPDRLCAKDLFEPGEGLAFETRIPQRAPFAEMTEPLQLQTTADRVLAITDAGTLLRAFSLQTGKVMPIPTRDGPPADAVATQAHSATTMMLIDDPYAYLISDASLAVYNLERVESPQRRLPSDATQLTYIAVGKEHLLTFDRPRAPAPAARPGLPVARANVPEGPATKLRALAFSRAQGKEGESGRLEQIYEFSEPSGIVDLTAIRGGVYYVTGTRELRFLAGTGKREPATQPK